MTNLTFTSEGEPYSVLLSQIHRSLCLIVRQRSLHDHVPFTDRLGLTCRVPPNEVVAMSGIYVDDFHCCSFSCGQVFSGYFTQDVENVGSTVSDNGC